MPRLRLHKNWNPLEEIYDLTKKEIEFQVMQDLQKYNQNFLQRYSRPVSDDFDVDNFVAENWGFEIVFDSLDQTEGEEILGCLKPRDKKIIVDADQCKTQARINFTIAHEAGHLSLHASMMRLENGKVVDWRDKPIQPQFANPEKEKTLDANQQKMERQANRYAGILLAPTHKVFSVLAQMKIINDNQQTESLDLSNHAQFLMDKFGMSRQALEIRLSDLKVSVLNKKY